jgi:outer membrane protein insertion porin family
MRTATLALFFLIFLFTKYRCEAATPPAAQPEPLQTTSATEQRASIVQFIGNTKFSDRDLRTALSDQLASIQAQGLSLPLADDAAYYLSIFYRRHGYPAVDVKYNIKGNRLLLIILEGRYYKLGEIYFQGNTTFKPEELKEYMVGTTRGRLSQFTKELPFVESDLLTGTSLLQSYYISEGFPQVQIVKMATRPDESRGAIDVIVTIKEGPRFFFGPIRFAKNPGVPMTHFYEQFRALTDQPKPYSDAEVQNLQRDLVFTFKKEGYYSATVTATPDFAHAQSGRVPIVIDSVPGPQYRFGAVEVHQDPQAKLRPRFLPKRFTSLQGQIYNPDELREKYEQLYLTALYDTIDIQEEPQPDHTIKLLVTPREARPKELGLYGGYDTFDGIILGGNYTNRNIDGWGHIFSASADYTSRGPDGEISYEDPWLFDTNLDFRAALGLEWKDWPSYSILKYYGRISFKKTFTRGIESVLFLEAKQADVNNIQIKPEELVGPNSYQLITLGLSQLFDRRDSPTNPHRGWVLDASASYSQTPSASSSFIRLTGRYSLFIPFGKTLLALGARIGYISAIQGQNSVPIDERFFNGGPTTVRSFYERKLGPKDARNNPLGGLARSVFNVEYDVPLFGDLLGAAFVDWGGLGNAPFDDMRLGIGGGIRYNLPIGPLRVDYAINPSPKKFESDGVLSLSFGFAF